MFSAVIVRLGYVQIVRGEEYKNEVEKKENSTISNPVPRGKIFDRYGRPVVDNRPFVLLHLQNERINCRGWQAETSRFD